MERPAAVPDGRVHKGWRHLRIVRGTDRSGVGRAGCRRGYPAGSARWSRWRSSTCQCGAPAPVIMVMRRPDTVKRAGARSTRSSTLRRPQPVPVARSRTARCVCMIW